MEFNLSNKRIKDYTNQEVKYHERDVKEFIRLLKNEIYAVSKYGKDHGNGPIMAKSTIINLIDQLAGEKLI